MLLVSLVVSSPGAEIRGKVLRSIPVFSLQKTKRRRAARTCAIRNQKERMNKVSFYRLHKDKIPVESYPWRGQTSSSPRRRSSSYPRRSSSYRSSSSSWRGQTRLRIPVDLVSPPDVEPLLANYLLERDEGKLPNTSVLRLETTCETRFFTQ